MGGLPRRAAQPTHVRAQEAFKPAALRSAPAIALTLVGTVRQLAQLVGGSLRASNVQQPAPAERQSVDTAEVPGWLPYARYSGKPRTMCGIPPASAAMLTDATPVTARTALPSTSPPSATSSPDSVSWMTCRPGREEEAAGNFTQVRACDKIRTAPWTAPRTCCHAQQKRPRNDHVTTGQGHHRGHTGQPGSAHWRRSKGFRWQRTVWLGSSSVQPSVTGRQRAGTPHSRQHSIGSSHLSNLLPAGLNHLHGTLSSVHHGVPGSLRSKGGARQAWRGLTTGRWGGGVG